MGVGSTLTGAPTTVVSSGLTGSPTVCLARIGVGATPPAGVTVKIVVQLNAVGPAPKSCVAVIVWVVRTGAGAAKVVIATAERARMVLVVNMIPGLRLVR